MNSQLACGKVVSVGSLPLENPMLRSHCTQVSCGFQRPIKQMCEPKTSRKVFRSKLGLPICASHSSKARQILPGRFASLSARGPVEVDQTGSTNVRLGSSLNEEQLGSKEETFGSSVGTPSPGPSSFKNWQAADKQLVIYCFISLMATGFMAAILAAVIPSLIALRRAARAFEKLADAAREELPGTMAAVRLSGMEISDLTMELNDLGQEISKGVRSSTRALTAAEAGIRQIGSFASNAWQERAGVQVRAAKPLVARAARQTRKTLVQTRSLFRSLLTLSRLTSWIGARLQLTTKVPTPILSFPSLKKLSRS